MYRYNAIPIKIWHNFSYIVILELIENKTDTMELYQYETETELGTLSDLSLFFLNHIVTITKHKFTNIRLGHKPVRHKLYPSIKVNKCIFKSWLFK